MASQTSGSPRAAARRRPNAPKHRIVPSSRSKSSPAASVPDPQIIRTLSALADGVLVMRRSGIITDADAGACSLFGITQKRLLGSPLLPHLSPKDRSAFRVSWKQLRAQGTMDVILHRTGKGADERFLALRCRIDASTGLIIGTLRDATEEHRTKRDQQEAEHRYRMFIGNSSEGIWCFGLKRPMTVGLSVKQQIAWFYRYGYLQVCNDAYAVMYGFNTAEEITGIMLKDVLDRKDPKNIAFLTAFITSGYKLRETETNEQDRHGNTFTVVNNLTGTVVDGLLINAWGTQRDVTEKNRQDAALKESKESYEGLIQRIPFVVYKWRRTPGGTYVLDYISPRLKDFFGVDPAELLSDVSRIFALMHAEDRDRFLMLNEEHARSLSPFFMECRFLHLGKVRWIQFNSTPTQLQNGDVLWDGIMQETTERRRDADALQQQSEQHRFLAEASRRLAYCDTDAGVYSLISEMFIALVPDSVVFVLKTSENAESSTLMEIGGIEDSIIARGAAILRYDPRGRTFKNKPEFAEQFCKPNLRKFNGGLYEASTGYVPKFVARGIEKLLGVSHYYSIGISSLDDYFGYLNIMTRGPLTVEASTIEAFVHQCYLALIKIRSVRSVKEEAARRRFFFEHATDGIGVLDKERRFVEVNKRFAEMHGYTADEMTALYSWDVNAEHTTRRAMEQLQPGAPDTQHIMETRHRRKDGSVLDVELSFSLFAWNNEPQVY
ncbi:MAG: PAS domain S-box protein, partial [Bacteroidetes bacterium]|nr:PAS domain S-box protein [Bacteroidota bacterium]